MPQKKFNHGNPPGGYKYQDGATVMYVTYDLERKTQDGGRASFPNIKRVFIPGTVMNWKCGNCKKKTGEEIYGVEIEYEGQRGAYKRKGYMAHRGDSTYQVAPSKVRPASQKFKKVVPVPENAENIHFYKDVGKLPYRYSNALRGVQ